MEVLQAILLGIIEGLTEFLPISSTGHLIVAEEYLDFKDQAKIFTVVIQLGAILAVVWFYRRDIARRVRGLVSKEKVHTDFWLNLLIATIPVGLLGLFLDRYFETYAVASVVAVAMIAGGIILWLVDRGPTSSKPAPVKLDDISKKQALTVGLIQCLAFIPGVSRAAASIVGGLFGGLNRPTATAFSFYLGIPVIGLASAYKLIADWHAVGDISGGLTSILAGLAAAFITALIAVTWLLKYVSTHNFRIFAYYRIIFGLAVLVLLV